MLRWHGGRDTLYIYTGVCRCVCVRVSSARLVASVQWTWIAQKYRQLHSGISHPLLNLLKRIN